MSARSVEPATRERPLLPQLREPTVDQSFDRRARLRSARLAVGIGWAVQSGVFREPRVRAAVLAGWGQVREYLARKR